MTYLHAGTAALIAPALEDVRPFPGDRPASDVWGKAADTLTSLAELADASGTDVDNAVADDVAGRAAGTGERLRGYEIAAIGRLSHGLLSFLFTQAEPMVTNEGSTTRHAYPVQFVNRALLDELSTYLTPPVAVAGQDTATTWNQPSAPSYLKNWLSEVSMKLRFETTVWDETQLGLYVKYPDNSPSVKTAFETWQRALRSIERDFSDQLAVGPELEAARGSAKRAEKAADAAEKTAGRTGTITLATYFDTLAAKEATSAGSWSKLAVGSLLGIVTVAFVVLLVGATHSQDWTRQLLHLALTLPVAALSAYASSVASRHRHQAWWAHTTAAQLQTISAYVQPLADDARGHVLEQFGLRIFAQPAFNTTSQEPETASMTAMLEAVLSRTSGKNDTATQ
ncbi:hypothetical protein [Rhodococcus sp. 06-235-1A]|uniref:hypothetical protein n=1 Tax=Rhodococcus sp. 06-235-1A TaxID=2022508 RepID=UPI00117B8FCE|nr:hypothetical protein [Rhodococcus sp. 06-235-1A]